MITSVTFAMPLNPNRLIKVRVLSHQVHRALQGRLFGGRTESFDRTEASVASTYDSTRVWWWFIFILLLGTGLLVNVGIGVAWFGYSRGILDYAFADLYRHQRAKIAAAGNIDVLFIGDSSLGNAIGTRHWYALTGKTALNLALTGAYGYGGSLNMLRQTLARTKPRNVVIFQTADMMARPTPYMGFIYTYPGGIPVGRVPMKELQKAYFNATTFLNVIGGIWSLATSKATGAVAVTRISAETDYVRQMATLSSEKLKSLAAATELTPERVSADHAAFLRDIADLCWAESLNCIYAHGPLYEGQCSRNSAYLAEVNRRIRETGFVLANEQPICIPREQIGDSEDHVRPDQQATYTAIYRDILAPHLR